MKFAPRPENDFAHYIDTYFRECRCRFDAIQAIAGKWMFRDLIPGMSDFDTRFIVRDGMSVDDWCAMSTAVGEAHLYLCEKHPCWARNLEHLPGINLTWTELTSERSYYPEYQQWTYYHSDDPQRLGDAMRGFSQRPWDVKDEYFHLKKFCLYYGRYDRTIDVPVNLGIHENKYPLHSRVMHYFSPPVMSAVCILEKQNMPGKFDAFDMAAQLFPDLECWDIIREILHAGYEIPKWYAEPQLVKFEDAMEDALAEIAKALREVVTLIPPEAGLDIGQWKKHLSSVPMDPALVIFDNAKFSRLMKGRLRFYANAPRHFDAEYLIENELKRINTNFFRAPFRVFWKIRSQESVENPVDILDNLKGDVLSDAEVRAAREFDKLTGPGWQERDRPQTALAIADIFDDFFSALTKIGEQV